MKKIIYDIIERHSPIKRRDLLIKLRAFHHVYITDRKMRILISELIADGECIQSSEKGYSIISNIEQLREAINYMKRKSRAISIRGNTLLSNYNQRYQDCPAQLRFNLV